MSGATRPMQREESNIEVCGQEVGYLESRRGKLDNGSDHSLAKADLGFRMVSEVIRMNVEQNNQI